LAEGGTALLVDGCEELGEYFRVSLSMLLGTVFVCVWLLSEGVRFAKDTDVVIIVGVFIEHRFRRIESISIESKFVDFRTTEFSTTVGSPVIVRIPNVP